MVDTVLIANGSANIGGGHIARSITLARELKSIGARVKLIITPEAQALADGFETFDIPIAPCEFTTSTLDAQIHDAEIICLDNYDWSAEFERTLIAPGRRLVVIDDLADRAHDCDLLIDQNFGRRREDYDGLIPDRAKRLIGVDFALLRPEFQQLRDGSIARRAVGSPAQNLLISLGMTDVDGVTGQVVEALETAGIDRQLNIILSRNAPSLQSLELRARANSRITLHIEPRNMAQLMFEADAALGAMGATTWERFCLGLPTIGLVLADNQVEAAKRLENAGLMASFANNQTGRRQAAEALASLLNAPERLLEQSRRIAKFIDGKGAARVAQEVLGLCG